MAKIYSGSCLCGDVKFTVTGFRSPVGHCHCSMCRKFHGAAFGTLMSVSNLVWKSGEDNLKDYVAPNGTIRTFCSNCGSSLGFRGQGVPLVDVELAAASFDEPIPISIDANIYTNYKVDWYNHSDGLSEFPEGRNE